MKNLTCWFGRVIIFLYIFRCEKNLYCSMQGSTRRREADINESLATTLIGCGKRACLWLAGAFYEVVTWVQWRSAAFRIDIFTNSLSWDLGNLWLLFGQFFSMERWREDIVRAWYKRFPVNIIIYGRSPRNELSFEDT